MHAFFFVAAPLRSLHYTSKNTDYHKSSEYWDRCVWADSIQPNQTASEYEQNNQSLLCFVIPSVSFTRGHIYCSEKIIQKKNTL